MSQQSDSATLEPPGPEHWDAFAEGYSAHLTRLAGGAHAMLLNAVDAGGATKLVDLGVGPGHLSHAAERRGAEVVGVDFSEKMLEIARFNAPEAEMRQGEATNIPVERRWANGVVASFVLHLLKDPVACVLDATRILADGGVFAATVWRRHSDNPSLGIFYDSARQCGIEVPEATQAGIPLWDAENLSRLLHRARLVDTEVRAVEWMMRVKAEDWWTAVYEGGPITGAFLRSLDGATHDKVRAAFLARMARLPREDDEVILPVRAIFGMGRVVR